MATKKAKKRTKKDSRKASDLQERATKRPAKAQRTLNRELSIQAPKWKKNSMIQQAQTRLDYLASFPEMNPNPVVGVNVDGSVQYLNQAAQQLFPDLRDLGPRHKWLVDLKSIGTLLKDKKKTSYVREIRIDGAWFEQLFILTQMQAQIRIYGRDITERKQAEEALRQSEERERQRASEFKALLETVPATVWVADDPECKYMLGNKATNELLRLPAESNVSMSSPDDERPLNFELYFNGQVIPAEDLPMQLAARTGKTITKSEFELRFTDSRSVWLYGNAVPLRNQDGAVRGAIGAFIDITERKQMEETLRESEEKYRTLVEQSLQGTFVIQDMRIVFCNRTFAKMGGYTPEEIYSFSPEEVRNLIHPDDQKRIWGRFRGRLEGKPLLPTHNDLRAFRKDGSIAWVEYDAVRTNYRGRPAMQVSLVDITKRKQAEEERERLVHSLQDSLAKIRRLEGMLPICASCKKIRDDKGYWKQMEVYIEEHSGAEFTHGICPDCAKKLYGISAVKKKPRRKLKN